MARIEKYDFFAWKLNISAQIKIIKQTKKEIVRY